MLTNKSGVIFFNPSFCQQCGTCLSACPNGAISSKLYEDGLSQIIINHEKCVNCEHCVRCCPANFPFIRFDLYGYCENKKYFIGSSKNKKICSEASSGGIARTIIIEGLKSHIFSSAYTLKKTNNYPYAEGVFIKNADQIKYSEIPNSIYHPIMFNRYLENAEISENILIVGTSCQLKGAEKILKGKYKKLYKVAIFCKQQKTFKSTEFFAKLLHEKINLKKYFRFNYRGDGWPGYVKINNSRIKWGIAAGIPFAKRVWTVPGCDICGDPFGDADITLMDPWLIESENSFGKNVIIVHNDRGMVLLEKIKCHLNLKPIDFKEVTPALMLDDIEVKQLMVPYFKGEKTERPIKFAGKVDEYQRKFYSYMAKILPFLPHIAYRILNKCPDLRAIIIRRSSIMRRNE